MNRRDLMRHMPAGLAIAALPVFTPIESLFSAWRYQRDRWREAVDHGTEIEEDGEFQKLSEIEDRMMLEPSQTPKDMAIKMLVGHGFGDHSCLPFDGPAWAEARALIGGAA